jgi:hypothetical protein
MKFHTLLAACLILLLSALDSSGLRGTGLQSAHPGFDAPAANRPRHPTEHPTPKIDGAVEPASIPEDIAYAIFFASVQKPAVAALERRRTNVAKQIFTANMCHDGGSVEIHTHGPRNFVSHIGRNI